MVHRFAAANQRKTIDLLPHALRRQQDGGRAPDYIVFVVPVQVFGAFIPRLNDPVQVGGDDGILGGVHQGGQQFVPLPAIDRLFCTHEEIRVTSILTSRWSALRQNGTNPYSSEASPSMGAACRKFPS